MKQLQLISTLIIGLLLSTPTFIYAQCTQTDFEGISYQVNCGGDDCANCLPILYNLLCEDGTGVFYVFVLIPESVWTQEEAANGYYLEITGDFQDTFDEAGQIISYQKLEGEGVYLQISKFDDLGNLIAYGEINEVSPPCEKGSEIIDCPDPNSFATAQETVFFDDSFMTRIIMQGGMQPYQIYDNVNGQFFSASVYEPEYYLGNFPYFTTLNITVIDALGCTSNFFTSAIPPSPTDDTDMDGTTGTDDVDGGTVDVVDDSDGTTGSDDADGGTVDIVDDSDGGTLDTPDSTDSGTVPIDEIEDGEMGFTIQKNPISLGQNINLKFTNNYQAFTTIELYNIKGQLQFNKIQLKNIINGQSLPLPLVKSAGTYIVKVQNGNDVYVKKVVVL